MNVSIAIMFAAASLAAGGERELAPGPEVVTRYQAFLECEGVVVNSQKFPERVGPNFVIELVKPVYLTGSKIYIDAKTGSVKWEHSKKKECRRPINMRSA